ncbi:TIGR01777 family oxidoreductase [Citricoccus sp. I39-566]|uniref:TIGR01777 family oxidoreductase n=1 Tax=Citricoccus sp. I39-566 TaxID=3073268 RepID=UPI00286CC3D2|nr:TIGR01777 family oxidoreductase [Citricoccus sp. I39-566]WMY77394.1 TIGR01777 family oxidoreductase [Citricoccus sp. I39-566]
MNPDRTELQPTVVIAGASGFIGTHLRRHFLRDGFRVASIGRHASDDARWGEGYLGLTSVLEGAEAVINLAGRSVSCRYTQRTADEILRSRTEATEALGRALASCGQPPSVWLNASTGTIYRDARDRPQDERTGELGSGFSVAVARAWEQELAEAPTAVRKVALRTTIALGAGGALNPIINLARMGFGGPQGDGGQRFSWIHLDDVYGAVRHLMDRPDISGPVNLAAPEAVTNRELMDRVRRHVGGAGERVAVPLPAWALEAGARIIRTEAELVLKSRWVHPGVLLDSGYRFAFPVLDDALADIAAATPRGLLPVPLG